MHGLFSSCFKAGTKVLTENGKECIKNNTNQYESTQLIHDKFFSSVASTSLYISYIQNFSSELDGTISIHGSSSKLNQKTTKIIETEKLIKKVDLKNMIQDLIDSKTNISKEEEVKYYDTILKSIENIFTSEQYDTTKLDNGEDEVIKTKRMTVIFTTVQNQKNDKNNNMTSINLGECETLLINKNNISDNQTL